jgi:hypothetical protein
VHSGDTDYWNTRRRSIVLAAPFSVAPDSTGTVSTTANALTDRPLGHSTVHTFATTSNHSDVGTSADVDSTEAAAVGNSDCAHAEQQQQQHQQQQQQQPAHQGRKMSISTSCCDLPLSAFEHNTTTTTTTTTTIAATTSANTVTAAQLRRESMGDECNGSATVSSGNGRKGGSRRRSLSSGNLHGLVHLPDF